MSLTSIGDLAQSLVTRRNLTGVKQQIQRYSKEMATGTAADLGKHLRGSFGPLHAIRNSLAQLSGYRIVANELSMRTTAMQSAFDSMDAAAAELAGPLLSAGSSGNHIAIDAIAATGRHQFASVVALLNTNIAGKSLFSGIGGNAVPLPDGTALLQQIEVFAANAHTAADVAVLVDQWFDSPSGYAAVYQGGDPAPAVGIAPGESVAVGITAASPAVKETLKGFAMAALLGSSTLQLDPDERALLAQTAGQALVDTQKDRADMRSAVASVENRLATALAQNTATVAGLEMSELSLVEVDPEQAAVRLTDAETRLELMYTVISRLSRLSLVNYLK